MTNAHWFLLLGGLLLARGLLTTPLKRLPFTSSIVYLMVGIVAGPTVLNVFYFDPLQQSAVMEVLTEVAVLISLFSAGVKMPVPVTLPRWRVPILLAWASMTISVVLVAAFAYFVLQLPLGAGILLGAILAPTDPVLATDVQIRHPGDNDKLRFTLTCEAGMNDGTAFPFVMLGMGLLGLHELGDFGMRWVLVDVLWATIAAVAIGLLCGTALARIGWRLRSTKPKHDVLDDLVGLGLIAVVYGISLAVNAWGFLAVFFAAVALRQTELKLAAISRKKDMPQASPIEAQPKDDSQKEEPPVVSEEALVFKEHLERLSELTLVLLLGGMMFLHFWNWQTVALGLFLFFIGRPLSVMLCLFGTDASWRVRSMTGWFGVRGIGSVYYLMYAIQHGLPKPLAEQLIQMTLVVITMSVFMHGTTVKPLLHRFWRPLRGLS